MKQRPHALAALLILTLSPAALHSQSASESPSPTELETMIVTGEESSGYTAPAAITSGLKTDTPLLETPQAISVITKELIKDQGVRKLEDVLRNAAGVSPGGYYSDWDYFRIRGFDSSFNTFLDGLNGVNGDAEELWGLERVEVIKGPASTLYGQAPLGGFVNMVSKRPHPGLSGEVQATVGSWDFYEGAIDINIPIISPAAAAPVQALSKDDKDGKNTAAPEAPAASGQGLYFRLNALYRNEGSFVDYGKQQRIYVAPSLLWQIGANTSLTILTSYKEDWIKHSFPLPAKGTVEYNINGEIPVSRYIGNPYRPGDVNERSLLAGFEFKHRFNDVVSVRQNFRYQETRTTWDDLLYPAYLDTDERTLWMFGYDARGGGTAWRSDTGVDLKFDTGPVTHSLTAGVDYRQDDSWWADHYGSYVSMDVFQPNYRAIERSTFSGWSSSDDNKAEQLGFYIQEQAKIFEKVTLTAGGRYDSFKSGSFDDEAFTPKVGLTYEFLPGVAAYANYSRSFTPQWYSTDADGNPVPSEEGVNWEGGVKYSLLEGKLTGLFAIYQLTRTNVATSNLNTPDPYDSIVSGEQRSRGFEFEIAAELAPGLNFTAAYSYIDAEVTEDNDIPVGTRLQGVPEHTVNAWLKYTLQDGPVKGLGAGIGGSYNTSQSGDTYDTFNLPAYGLLNAALYYERNDFRVQVNFNNITDRRYFSGSYNSVYVLPGEPFNLSASVSWKF